MVPETAYYIIFFIAGITAGSFFNAVIYRLPRKISIVKRRSFCPSCRSLVPWYHNIPLFSYLVLGGRCRSCRARIPVRYPMVEFFTGCLFLLNYHFFGISLQLLNGIILCSVLMIVSFIDIDFRIIPNVVIIPSAIAGLSINIAENPSLWWMPLAFSAGAFAFMFIIHLIYPRGMGMGDVKFSLMAGAFLVRSTIPALFLGFLTGSLYGLVLIIKKRRLRQTIPFGPFISLGSIIALFWGDNILKWYISFF